MKNAQNPDKPRTVGRKPKFGPRVQITSYLPVPIHEAMMRAAFRCGLSRVEFVAEAVAYYIEHLNNGGDESNL